MHRTYVQAYRLLRERPHGTLTGPHIGHSRSSPAVWYPSYARVWTGVVQGGRTRFRAIRGGDIMDRSDSDHNTAEPSADPLHAALPTSIVIGSNSIGP